MNKEELINYVKSAFPNLRIEEAQPSDVIYVGKDELFSVSKSLKEAPETQFDFLACQTTVDKQPYFEVVYNITSTVHRHSLVLKVILENREFPELESVVSLWKAAELYECEIYDLFGIKFLNHPTLRRIFLGDEWKGFPLRKDYIETNDEIQMTND